MADNVQFQSATPATPDAATIVATDEIAGRHFQLFKLAFGAAGDELSSIVRLPVALDAATLARLEPYAVQAISGNVGILGTVPVSGAFFQATQPVSGPLTDAQLRSAAVPISIASSIAVTGTFFQATQPISAAALPLPTGAASSAAQDTGNASLLSIDAKNPALVSGRVPVDGSEVTQPVDTIDTTATGALAALNAVLAVSTAGRSGAAIEVTGAFVGTIQFEGSLNGTTWTPINAVQAGTTNILQTTTVPGLYRLTPGGLQQIRANMIAWTSGSAAIAMRASLAVGGIFFNQALPPGVNTIGNVGVSNLETQITGSLTALNGVVQIDTTKGALVTAFISGTYSQTFTFEIFDGTTWYPVAAKRGDTTAVASSTGALVSSSVVFQVPCQGAPQMRIRCSAFTSGSAAIVLRSLAIGSDPVNGVVITGTVPVSGTVTANQGTMAALPAGANAIGDVGLQARANATGAMLNARVMSAATVNNTLVKASAGRVLGWSLSNTSAAAKFVKIYNKSSAPIAGTDTPVLTLVIPAGGTIIFSSNIGIALATGFGYAITNLAADADTTAVALNDVIGGIFYA